MSKAMSWKYEEIRKLRRKNVRLFGCGAQKPRRPRKSLQNDVKTFGVAVLKTPIRAPKANAYCEKLIGSLRRECLDWFIPLNERHVRMLAREWAVHYNQGRPHKSLGPGIPDPPPGSPVTAQIRRHAVSDGFSIKKKPILGGLHHEYRLERTAA